MLQTRTQWKSSLHYGDAYDVFEMWSSYVAAVWACPQGSCRILCSDVAGAVFGGRLLLLRICAGASRYGAGLRSVELSLRGLLFWKLGFEF